MEEKVMNKRFDIYCRHGEADAFDGTDWDKYDVLLRFLEDVVKKENKKAYELFYEIYCGRKRFDDYHTVYHFNRAKKLYKYWSDEEITSAIETLVKYGFLVKVDNNTANFYEDGNEELIASMMKESA